MSRLKKTTVYVKGMHCASCDLLVKRKFSEEGNIRDVCPNYQTQKVEITYTGTLTREALNKRIQQYGYTVVSRQEKLDQVPYPKRVVETLSIVVVLMIVYYFAREFKLTAFLTPSSDMNYLTGFVS